MKTSLALCLVLLFGLFFFLRSERPSPEIQRDAAIVEEAVMMDVPLLKEAVARMPISPEVSSANPTSDDTSEKMLKTLRAKHELLKDTFSKLFLYEVLEHRLNQVKDLKSEYVFGLLNEHEPEDAWVSYVEFQDTLYDYIPWPNEADVDMLWDGVNTRGYVEKIVTTDSLINSLDAKIFVRIRALRKSFDEKELANNRDFKSTPEWHTVLEKDKKYTSLREERDGLRVDRAQQWTLLWRSIDPNGYPHWPFLMKIAELHLL